jgi:hypothetical protein
MEGELHCIFIPESALEARNKTKQTNKCHNSANMNILVRTQQIFKNKTKLCPTKKALLIPNHRGPGAAPHPLHWGLKEFSICSFSCQ